MLFHWEALRHIITIIKLFYNQTSNNLLQCKFYIVHKNFHHKDTISNLQTHVLCPTKTENFCAHERPWSDQTVMVHIVMYCHIVTVTNITVNVMSLLLGSPFWKIKLFWNSPYLMQTFFLHEYFCIFITVTYKTFIKLNFIKKVDFCKKVLCNYIIYHKVPVKY